MTKTKAKFQSGMTWTQFDNMPLGTRFQALNGDIYTKETAEKWVMQDHDGWWQTAHPPRRGKVLL